MPARDQLLGWDVSPYTAKVRSYLNYKGINYEYKPPNVYTLSRKVQPATGKMIMPTVFRKNGIVLQDSSQIIDIYDAENDRNPVIPGTPKQAFSSLLLELFADEWLPMASLHYRWNYEGNYPFIIGEFGKNALPYFPGFVQRKAAKQFAGKMSGYLPILGITRNMQAPLEAAVENMLSLLDKHFQQCRFLLGDQPTIGDFALYGQIHAHLDRDPVPADLVSKYHHLHDWLKSMHGESTVEYGELAPEDNIPDTLLPILQQVAKLQGPLLQQTITAVTTWSQEHSDREKLPQRIGEATLTIAGNTESRYNLTYGYWMIQRIRKQLDCNQNEVAELIQDLGLQSVFLDPLPIQVELKQCRLHRIQ